MYERAPKRHAVLNQTQDPRARGGDLSACARRRRSRPHQYALDRYHGAVASPLCDPSTTAGSLDLGMTGDTPPIFAQAAGRDVLYIGQESPKPHSSAILVQNDSSIDSLRALH